MRLYMSRKSVGLGSAAIGLMLCMTADAGSIVNEILSALPKQRALVVQVGVGSSSPAVDLGKLSHLVHGLEPDAANTERVTGDLLKTGLTGQVWIETGAVAPLPYVNNLANAVFVDDWQRMKEQGLTGSEVLRVLAPEGVACVGQRSGSGSEVSEKRLKRWLGKADAKDIRTIKRDGVWLLFRKPRPAGMDEWTHELHDATRNPATQDRIAGVPQQIHWIGGTPYSWQIQHYRTAGNRVVVFYTGQRGLSRWRTFPEPVVRIEVLDAFNGIRLWKREYSPPAKGFYPIVIGNRIIIQTGEKLKALNAADGEPVFTYENAGVPYAGVVSGDTLVCVRDSFVKALNLNDGKLLWKRAPEQGNVWEGGKQKTGWLTYNPVVAENMVLLLEKYRVTRDGATVGRERIIGLDLKTGKEVWRFDEPIIGGHHKRHFYYQGRLFFSVRAGFVGIPLAKDEKVWTLPVTPLDRRFWAGNSFFGVNGMFWVRQGPGKGGFLVGEEADTKQPIAPKTWVGTDVQTGKVVKKIGYKPGISGWRGRCYADLAGPNFIYSDNGEFVDLNTEKISNYRIFRGHCGWGPFFGNGFFYGTPTWCIFCYPALHGAIAAGPELSPATPVKDDQRIEKGPAFSEDGGQKTEDGKPDEWPVYRQNARRTAGTPVGIPLPLSAKPVWKQTFGERITGSVIADGMIYLAVVNQGRICALDEKTGKPVWSVSAGPRIDSPPTRYRGLLLFGSHDGYVYALRASDGARVWRFRAAPDRRLMACTDRVESAWPLPGAVLIHDGVLYCMAGRITGADGGMHMYALDPMTGKMKWRRTVGRTTNPKLATGGDPKLYYWIEPEGQLSNNHLVGNGDRIRLPDQHFFWEFNTKDGKQVVPESVQAVHLSTFTSQWPWLGYDRPTWSYTFQGSDIHAEYRHPYESGTMMAYTDVNSVGIVCKRLRKDRITELIPTKVDDAAGNWDPKTRGEIPWGPLKLKTDVHALVLAGDTAFVVGMDFALHPKKGRVLVISMKDGKEVQNIELPALPTYDGAAVAHGRLYVSLQDGTLLSFGK